MNRASRRWLSAIALMGPLSLSGCIKSEITIDGRDPAELAREHGPLAVLLIDPGVCLTCAQAGRDQLALRQRFPDRVRFATTRIPSASEANALRVGRIPTVGVARVPATAGNLPLALLLQPDSSIRVIMARDSVALRTVEEFLERTDAR